MAIDLYSPRAMGKALRELKPARSFLRSLFFPTVETSVTEHVDIDTMVGTRRLAPFVNTNGPGKVSDRRGYSTSTVTPPLVAPKRLMSVQDLQKRSVGESIYSDRTPDDRAAEMLLADLADLDDQITRREEWMCARALFDSSIRVLGDDVDQTITYARNATLTKGLLGATSRWSHADAVIDEQIRGWRRDIIKICGANPDYMICSPEAIDALLKSPKMIGSAGTGGKLSTLRLDMGTLKPELRDSGATYFGELAGTGIQIWSYDEWFIDPADETEKPMVPEKMILIGSSMAQTAMRYGAVGVSSGDGAGSRLSLEAAARVPESWTTREPAVRHLKVSSRPLPVPVQNNAFLTAQVIA